MTQESPGLKAPRGAPRAQFKRLCGPLILSIRTLRFLRNGPSCGMLSMNSYIRARVVMGIVLRPAPRLFGA